MKSVVGYRALIFSVAGAIIVQVITFGFLWGSLTTTVNAHTVSVGHLEVVTTDNTRNIDKILAKFDLIEFIQGKQGIRGERGIQGSQGVQGDQGVAGVPGR